ncbi:MAG TPA: GAF domain-containing SpoIIE family protein phosphatase [Solirubrobacteraceae bacterium]|nr:GAF domain-containing SpoIIE family protein phosphatase [Solirubrobacteraceae bacterium]
MAYDPAPPDVALVPGASDAEAELQALRAVTDSTLARLDVEDLMRELLGRVRRILGADTAVVLSYEPASRSLVARVSSGLDEEVIQGVHVSLGEGFAGRIAATRQPLLLDVVDATTVANPVLVEKGIRKMLGVPLLAGDDLIGVLHVGRLDERSFDAHDAELLQVAAERLAGASEARRVAVEHAAAALLERSLLPTELPDCPGLAFARRYLTPNDRTVGGDWYDLFTLPSGDLWIVVGDVAGHGLPAAVVMGRIRSTLRSYALLGVEPHTALELTDRKIRHFEGDALVTVVCAVSAPPYDRLRVTVAGHPPPVVALPGRPAAFAELPVDPPLGVPAPRARSSGEIHLPDGAVAVLYTDGLVERRREPLDDGLERLRGAVAADDPEVVCRTVLRSLVGARSPSDDVTLVAVRREVGRSQ